MHTLPFHRVYPYNLISLDTLVDSTVTGRYDVKFRDGDERVAVRRDPLSVRIFESFLSRAFCFGMVTNVAAVPSANTVPQGAGRKSLIAMWMVLRWANSTAQNLRAPAN